MFIKPNAGGTLEMHIKKVNVIKENKAESFIKTSG